MPEKEKQLGRTPANPNLLEREEARLWRVALLFVVLLATALAAVTWERLQALPYHLGVLPIAVLFVAISFAAFTYGRRKQVTELRDLVRGLQDHVRTPPTDEQLDQLSQVIARSQRSFKELIDSFDDVAFAFSLDGTIRTVNRSVTQLLGIPYSAIVGCKLDEFIEQPPRSDLEQGLARFLERRRWSGMVQVKLKKSSRSLFFDCVLNAIVKGDEVVGVSTLARDVTEER